ncbi:CinA family protein [Microbacterium sp. NPDC091313]
MDSEEHADLVERLSETVADAGITIAVAESLSSGALSAAIGRAEGAGAWFGGGVVAYRMSSKTRALGVDPDLDPCSAECARQLAEGVRDVIGADLAVSITGVGGPDWIDGHAPGTVYVGVSSPAGVTAERYAFDGDPAAVVEQSVLAALRMITDQARRLVGAR